jgi:glycosyltransferase involved in cell wall biosynthesis
MDNNKIFESTIVIPVFNEENYIKELIDKIFSLRLNDRFEIIVIDDGSTDSTTQIIKEYPVTLIKHNINKGYGAALKTGIRKARGRKIIIFDSDGQHDPKDVLTAEKLLAEHDLVIGERLNNSYQVKSRQPGKKLIRWTGEYLVSQKLPDYNSGFRGFNADLIRKMLHIMPNGFSFSTTSTLAFIKEGYSVATFPINVEERKGRKSSINFIRDGTKTLLLLFRIIMLFNPLKVFFPASVLITSIGLIFGIYAYMAFGRFANTAVIVSMIGVLLFFIGLLADQIAIMNRRIS